MNNALCGRKSQSAPTDTHAHTCVHSYTHRHTKKRGLNVSHWSYALLVLLCSISA